MKIFISADIEGISGVVNNTQTGPGGYDYNRARLLMTKEVNAAIEGALEAGADEIIVNDSHGPMTNILIEELNPNAQLITGTPKIQGMMEGLDSSFDAAILIGYHGRMNSKGVLSHSYHGKIIYNISINGMDSGEFYINSCVSGHYNVPVIMVSGDNILHDEVKAINKDIEAVVVKTSHGRYCAQCLTPSAVHSKIKEGAKKAIKNIANIKPVNMGNDITMEVTFIRSGYAEAAAIMPGTDLVAPNKVSYKAKSALEAYRALLALTMIVESIL